MNNPGTVPTPNLDSPPDNETLQYVVVLSIDSAELAELQGFGLDDSIENACRHVNVALDLGTEGTVPTTIRPLSEVIAA